MRTRDAHDHPNASIARQRRRARVWGGWQFNGKTLQHIEIEDSYPIDLIRFMSTATMLNMVLCLAKHHHASDGCIAGMVRALIELEDMTPRQRVMCAGLKSSLFIKKKQKPKARAKAAGTIRS